MKKLDYDVVLFDLDGTLIDSLEGVWSCFNYAFEQMGKEKVAVEDFLPFMGPPIMDTLRYDFKLSEEDAKEAMAHYRVRYEKKGWHEIAFYDGVEEMLKGLKAKGKKISLATNKIQYYAIEIMKNNNLDHYFDFIGGSDEEKGITNKHLVIENCLKQLGVTDRSRVIMVGDRKFDIAGAKSSNIDTIGVTYGYGSREELNEHGAIVVVDTTKEVCNLL